MHLDIKLFKNIKEKLIVQKQNYRKYKKDSNARTDDKLYYFQFLFSKTRSFSYLAIKFALYIP